eukprot:7855234-Pyramimonas_sp.AAC.1
MDVATTMHGRRKGVSYDVRGAYSACEAVTVCARRVCEAVTVCVRWLVEALGRLPCSNDVPHTLRMPLVFVTFSWVLRLTGVYT